MVNAGMPTWLAVIVAIAVCAVVGVLVETFAYRPVRQGRADVGTDHGAGNEHLP